MDKQGASKRFMNTKKHLILPVIFLLFFCTGCDFIYGLLQKEGAEEKRILGEVIPFNYNAKVEEVQRLLGVYGYNPGKADGKIGVNTRNSIARFQEDHDLKVTRFVDKKTWAKLNLVKDVNLIEKGEMNLKTVQEILANAGFYSGKIDGKAGPQTQKAIKDFQKARRLKADGVIGAKTISELIKYLPAQP